jgi:hypothetical protein
VKKFRGLLLLAASAAVSVVCLAQSPTSRTIPESAATTLPANTTQTVTAQLWSSATGGNLVLSETEPSLSVDSSQRVAFLLGSQTVGGLSSSHFVSGNSLYLDILQSGMSVISGGRIPLYAAPFSLTTGPAGSTGPQGPMGIQGPKGATGPQGPTGLIGATGAKGATGATGPDGPRGIQGLTGATGATGPEGPTGLTGPKGSTGATGPQGPTGQTGAKGATGAQGIQGLTGAAGTPGAAGPVGAQGPQGLVGATGPQGIQRLAGATGSAGTNGTNGTNGAGFNFRGAFDPNGSYAVNDVVTSAPITYNVNLTFTQSQCSQPGCTLPGATPTAVGTVTTDGTIGALNPSNIISFNLTLFDGSHTAILNPSTGASVIGNGLSATTTSLSVDYAVTAGFVAANGQLCFSGNGNCFPGPGAGMWGVGGNNLWVWTGGIEPIATGGTSSQSTYIATASVAAGSSAPGTAPWATMAAAGAPGTPGAAGPTGPAGPQGLQGLMGSIGPQGTPGTNGTNGLDGINGTNGAPGPQGPQGPVGATGSAGAAGQGFNWTGPWSASGNYNVGDVASFGGTSYIATAANTNQQPDTSDSPTGNITFTVTFSCNSGVNGTYNGSQPEGCYSAVGDPSATPTLSPTSPNTLVLVLPQNPIPSLPATNLLLEGYSGTVNGNPVSLQYIIWRTSGIFR